MDGVGPTGGDYSKRISRSNFGIQKWETLAGKHFELPAKQGKPTANWKLVRKKITGLLKSGNYFFPFGVDIFSQLGGEEP